MEFITTNFEAIFTLSLLIIFCFALFTLFQTATHKIYVDGKLKHEVSDFETAKMIQAIEKRYGAKNVKIKSRINF